MVETSSDRGETGEMGTWGKCFCEAGVFPVDCGKSSAQEMTTVTRRLEALSIDVLRI